MGTPAYPSHAAHHRRLLAASGAYLLAYWTPVAAGGRPPSALSLSPLAAATWITTRHPTVVTLALAVLALVTAVAVAGRHRRALPTRGHEQASKPTTDLGLQHQSPWENTGEG